ncbi:hypothetical protein Q2K19_30525 [Micromonospora soli]|uniref:allene oxide cyclase barrel-like domain-containing protein n=1 Tax=Micromonospora sp. NBRC 110009 TaxID=3061627 RepID=UPI00267135D7|nr:hypothetical protein [Micromonospora sp. NBRC 110009]WKT98440.1 hypothetical protein Q2K19_30525 [Micromonospora sp. NBRC 110009]
MAALAGAVGSHPVPHQQTLRLLDTGATIDVFLNGGDASHTGDREVFRDTLVWAEDQRPAGKAEGHCTVIDAFTATTTCTIVTTLHEGTLTTEGVGTFVPGTTSTAAITGGTGAYEGAKGHATFLFNPAGHSPVTFVLSRP